MRQRPPSWRVVLAWLGAATVLALVFWAYLDPHAVADLSNRIWSCYG